MPADPMSFLSVLWEVWHHLSFCLSRIYSGILASWRFWVRSTHLNLFKCEFHPCYLPFSPYSPPTDIVQRGEKLMFGVTKEGIVGEVMWQGERMGKIVASYLCFRATKYAFKRAPILKVMWGQALRTRPFIAMLVSMPLVLLSNSKAAWP